MIEPLVLATYVLASFTALLAISTAVYTYYIRKQNVLMRIGHSLTAKHIAITALTGPIIPAGTPWRQATISGEQLQAKMKEFKLSE